MRKVLTFLAVGAFLYFFGRFVLSYSARAEDLIGTIAPSWLLIAIATVFFGFFLQVRAWSLSFMMNEVALSKLTSLYLFCTAALAAYIPGKIPGVLITAELAKDHGVSRLESSVAIVVYQVMSLVACGIMGLVFLVMTASWRQVSIEVVIIIGVVGVGLFVAQPANLNWIIQTGARLFISDVTAKEVRVGFDKLALLLLHLCAVWTVSAIMVNLLRSAIIGDLALENFATVATVFLFSYVLGAAVVIVPSGIGVFETSLYFGLRQALSEEEAVAIAALSRLIMVIPPLSCYFFLVFLRRTEGH